jgi:hypothetical protein
MAKIAIALGLLTMVGCAAGVKLPPVTPAEVADGAACVASVEQLASEVQHKVAPCVSLGNDLKAKAATASK